MQVVFSGAIVSDFTVGTSKAGNPYGVLTFLDADFNQYRVFVSQEYVGSCSSVPQRVPVDLVFALLPDRDGGVRLRPDWS